MFDVFYSGPKPGLFAFEQPADSLDDAAKKSRTTYYWYIYGLNDYTGFDFDYVPVPWESEYIHVWPNQWQQDGEVYLAKKTNSGAFRYHTEAVHRLPLPNGWYIPDYIDSTSIDFRWCPDPCDPPLVYHIPDQHQSASGATYTIPGATNIKLVSPFIATATENKTNWTVPDYIDANTVDFTWHPNPLDPPYIYHFPSQHQSASGVTYTVPGATEVKLIDSFVVQSLPVPYNFKFNIAVATFDYSWHPNVLDPAYDYAFGNQWNPATIEPTVIYHVDEATEIKYMDEIAHVAKDMSNWEILDDITGFDYSWRPDPTEPPYIYVFGNQWLTPEQRPALQYRVASATQYKYLDEPKATRQSNPSKFKTHYPCEFDYSWEPDPGSPLYNYVFGNQWYPGEIMPTVEYPMPGATETKFVEIPARLLPVASHPRGEFHSYLLQYLVKMFLFYIWVKI